MAIEGIWSDKTKKTGNTSTAEDAIIFEREGDPIKYWREYIDIATAKVIRTFLIVETLDFLSFRLLPSALCPLPSAINSHK